MKPTEIKHLHPKLDAAAGETVTTSPDPGINPGEDRVALIAEAHTRVLDITEGFEKLTEKAEPDFRPVAETYLFMHRKHEAELAAYLRQCGHEPDNDGSFFGAVNRALVEMRSWFEEVDDAVMDRIIQGEKHVLDAYENARNVGQTVEANALLTRHMSELDRLMQKHAG
ncbi:DUF2383 domain-containing protein [Roseinatronobacter alkalisoli]|uniref:DUF2383 domain-containing protein n=1 Tax=Roseinatronobacter alkalisoli TaxID=3028235 RepID=A0ABT5TBP2_9RHOB|nr:DUF2383 domain-containing protein [Roseinatronobacter sp. HJB301]MDD7971343.1 DUF2383 domain-containing protein [Roseinatronobacter sp. HJB301]